MSKRKERACGTRDQESAYACLPLSYLGYPFEYFYIFPARPWNGPQLRAPQPVTVTQENEDGEEERVTHLLLSVGKSYYPTAPSFLEEGKAKGISKKIPIRSLPWEQLDPGKSQVFLIHPRAIPTFEYKAEGECPKNILKRKLEHIGEWLNEKGRERFASRIEQIKRDIREKIRRVPEDHQCLGDLWPLSYLINNHKHQVYKTPEQIPQRVRQDPHVLPRTIDDSDRVMIALWGEGDHHILTYTIDKPRSWGKVSWRAGIFFHYPLFKIEYVSSTGTVPGYIKDAINTDEKDWDLRVCEK